MQAVEATYGGVGSEQRVFTREGEAVAARMQDSIDGIKIEERQAAAEIESVGKYEPKLIENGIPDDVLAKLLPGDDVLELTEPKVAGRLGYRFIKRAFDVASCGCALIVLAIPMAIIAAKIKLESYGPVIYSQRRVGKDGKIFNVYKFRSMYSDAEARGARWAAGDDPRVTPFGKFMREKRMASVIIGTPGAGEPTNSLSSAAKTSFDQQFYDRRPEVSPATQSIIPAPNSCLFTFFGGSRKAQYELEARADGADQGGSPWRGKASSSMIEKGAYCLTPALGVAA